MSINNEPLVRISGGNRLITTSLAVSKHFGKKHKDVLRAIKELDCSHEFARRNFTPCTYQDGNQRPRPMYEITRDGFMFLCMGFTGASASKWKEKYITAFNAMEQKIHADQQMVDKLQVENQNLKQQVISHNPFWSKLLHYKALGLNNSEVARLLQCADSTVGRNIARMNKLNLLTTTVQAQPKPQQLALEV